MADYDLLLRARALVTSRLPEDIAEALEILEEIAGRLPDHGEVQAQLAFAHLLSGNYPLPDAAIDLQQNHLRAQEVAERALDQDSRNVTALVVKATLHNYRYEFEEAERLFRRALTISPNSSRANNWYGDMLWSVMRHEEAIQMERRAVELDPLLSINHSNLARTLQSAGRIAEAEASYRRSFALNPDRARFGIVLFLLSEGRFSEMAVFARDHADLFTEGEHDLYRRLAADRDSALIFLSDAKSQSHSTIYSALLYGALGEYELSAPLIATGDLATGRFLSPVYFPTDPDILAANPKYAAFWQTPPRDRLLRARGHWIEQE